MMLNLSTIPFLANFKIKRWRKYLIALIKFKYENFLIFYTENENSKTRTTHIRAQNLRLINGRFPTISSHFFANYMNIFHKNEVQTVILRCWTGLKLNWFKSYGTNAKKCKNAKNITQMRSFSKKRETEILTFCET